MARKAKKQVVRRVPTVLPKKMSKLIEIALKDLRKMEELPDEFVVNMETWFQHQQAECSLNDGTVFKRHRVCVACLAGGVMAFTLRAKNKPGDQSLGPRDFGRNSDQLESLDLLREGDVRGAAERLGLIPDESEHDADIDPEDKTYKAVMKVYDGAYIPEYDLDNPEPFHRAMNRLATTLKRNGL